MTSHLLKAIGLTALVLATTPGPARAAPVAFDLWAMPGTIQLAGLAAPTPAWGYAAGAAGPASVPGPVLIVTQGDTVTVTLHNGLAEATALDLAGQGLVPDEAGVPAGGSKAYAFTAGAPGTYLYQAGPLPGAQHQVPMGLYGALVVRPAAGPAQAYESAATTFDDEAVLVLSEVDPALNAAPASFDLRRYAPTHFLLNGKSWPATDPIPTGAGRRLLLRYLNAGLKHHSMALLGLSQVIVAQDGNPRTFGQPVVAETLAPGQTLDAIATVPAAPPGSRFALHEGSLRLANGTGTGASSGFGGMLTFLTTGAGGGGSPTGPAAGAVALAPNPTTGSAGVAVSATLTSPGGAVAGAEYFVDATGPGGSGTPLSGSFGGPTAAASGIIPASLLATLAAGNHTVYVRGQDGAGTWGALNFAVLTLDTVGPATIGPSLTPNPTGGALDVAVHATGDDTGLGGSRVVAAELTIDGGAATAMAVNAPDPVASLDAVVPAATVGALAAGPHLVAIRSQDALGTWGAPATITLTVDRTGPGLSPGAAVAASPSPATGSAAVRISTSFTDATSNVTGAEGFLDPAAAPPSGTGFAFAPADGSFGSTTEAVFADVPASTVARLAVGSHVVQVRGRDAVGNWGALASGTLLRSGTAAADTLAVTANGSTTPQQANVAAPGLLANDLPAGTAGRTASLVSGPLRTSGTGAATIRVTCGGAAATAVCANGSYRVTLTPVGGSAAARRTSKLGTYQFTYRMTLNGVASPPATVTIVVN